MKDMRQRSGRASTLTRELLRAAAADELTRETRAALLNELYEMGDRVRERLGLENVACHFYKAALELSREAP